jgi:cytochrome c biogenesis protein CcmG/thiol:disulfide interchange protein DsbE
VRRLAVTLALVLAGCGGSQLPHDGGRAMLPGSLPEGVSFAAATSTATAPPFALRLLDGTRVDAARLWRDRPLVVFFLASLCSRCASQQERLAPLVERDRDVVTFVGVAGQDRAPAVRSWLGAHDVTYPVGIDGRLETGGATPCGPPPAVILVGPGGKLLRGWPGGVETDALDAELQRLVRR